MVSPMRGAWRLTLRSYCEIPDTVKLIEPPQQSWGVSQVCLGARPTATRPGSQPIAEVGEDSICTSIVVAAELRYGADKPESTRGSRLSVMAV